MSDHLLPPNATPQERALSETTARLEEVPVRGRDLWNPDTCPARLLPWLAWALSVDRWNNDWTDEQKRRVIKASMYVHQHKGTLGAVRRSLDTLDYLLIDIVEWWEDSPAMDPYTFRLEVTTLGKPVSEETYAEIERLVEASKNLRSHLSGLLVSGTVEGNAYVGASIQSGMTTTVYPYAPQDLESAGVHYWAASEQSIDKVTIYPAGNP